MRNLWKSAAGAGYRAGRAEPRVIIPGGTRGIKRLQEPTNPYADVFHPERRNWFLAMIWNYYYVEGLRERLSAKPVTYWRMLNGGVPVTRSLAHG